MTDNSSYVNVFQGCGEIRLPEPQGVAATWYFIKGLSGNTHPGAVLPFGKYSCCLYSGGYPTGYGVNRCNTGFKVDKLMPQLQFRGLSHFHQSGTGAIDEYYNYAVTAPFFGDFETESAFAPKKVLSESAVPGYYGVRTEKAECEATVSERIVNHRYTFLSEGSGIAVDFMNNGLYDGKKMRQTAMGCIRRISDNEIVAEMVLSGVKVFFDVKCVCDRSVKSKVFTRCGVSQTDSVTVDEATNEKAGGMFCFTAEVGTVAEIRLATSFVSLGEAHSSLEAEGRSFEIIKADAAQRWSQALSRIEIETDDEREKEIFYSNLYHTLVKPADFGTDSFIDGWRNSPFLLDYATFWDIYKTQLPLLFTLYPDISEKIMSSVLEYGRIIEKMPHTVIISSDDTTESAQARALAEHSVADAMFRGVKADYPSLLNVMTADMQRPGYADYFTSEGCSRTTYTLDLSQACYAVSAVARKCGRAKTAELLERYSLRYESAFERESGLLRDDSKYYEGNKWNYSFRPFAHMKERIALVGEERFVSMLDKFFGFTDKDDKSARFEGFNNESDMEAPYAYCYTKRHDRLCEIIDAGNKYMFTTGRGGIPGNNDSGGLSSCYIWNTLGVFPVSGQNMMLIGTPRYKRAVLHLANGKDFTVIKNGNGIYVKAVALDGEPLDDKSFTVTRMMNGGVLEFTMSSEPVFEEA